MLENLPVNSWGLSATEDHRGIAHHNRRRAQWVRFYFSTFYLGPSLRLARKAEEPE
jgi:hypothetical protein